MAADLTKTLMLLDDLARLLVDLARALPLVFAEVGFRFSEIVFFVQKDFRRFDFCIGLHRNPEGEWQ